MGAPNDAAGLETLGPIQLIPPGLTGLLALKQTGRLPGELSQLVRPVLELRDWYLESRRLNEVALFGSQPTVTVATGGNGAKFFVPNAICPPGNIMYVEECSVTGATALAADVLSFGLIKNPVQPAGELILVAPIVVDIVTARIRSYLVGAPRGFWLPTGYAIACWVADVSTAGIALNLSLRATLLPL